MAKINVSVELKADGVPANSSGLGSSVCFKGRVWLYIQVFCCPLRERLLWVVYLSSLNTAGFLSTVNISEVLQRALQKVIFKEHLRVSTLE